MRSSEDSSERGRLREGPASESEPVIAVDDVEGRLREVGSTEVIIKWVSTREMGGRGKLYLKKQWLRVTSI